MEVEKERVPEIGQVISEKESLVILNTWMIKIFKNDIVSLV